MTRLTWGELEKRKYEFGVDRGAIYPKNGVGTAWNGLTSVKEVDVGGSQSLIYVDGIGHQNQLSIGSFSATIEAITYPKEFEPFDGYSEFYSAQGRRPFDFSYRTLQDNDGYKIHLVYNALADPSQRNGATLNGGTEMALFAWDISTSPEVIPDARASSHFVIDTTEVNPGLIAAIENRLYGTNESMADMPTVPELLAIFEELALFRVTPHGDGTVTITGNSDAVKEISATLWQLTWPSVIQKSVHTYKASSL